MLQFAGPALQGASMIGRFGIPLLQLAGISAGMAGIGAGINALTNKPQLTGRQKLAQAWGKIPDSLNPLEGGGFGYRNGKEPSYSDAQGNVYDAVSGRLFYGVKPRAGSDSGSTGGDSLGGGSSAAERAFQAEKSRVAQLTAQDPELKRYADARKLAVAPGATPEQVQSAEDIGMQIWAAKHGNLAKKVKPGQSGYEAIQRTLYPGGTPASALPAESEAMLNAIAPTNEFGVRPNVTPMPGQLPSFGSNTEAMFNAITGGGSLVTPMPQQFVATTPQDQAQGLAETYKKALLGDLGNAPLGIAGIYRYGR
jgi:hypothetical protein